MPEPAPTIRYTGLETCAKCGATEITTGYDGVNNWVELRCTGCTYQWHVLPMDVP